MDLARWARANRAAMSADEWSRTARAFVLLLAPFVPHLAEELWARLGGSYSVHTEAWPSRRARPSGTSFPSRSVMLRYGPVSHTITAPAP